MEYTWEEIEPMFPECEIKVVVPQKNEKEKIIAQSIIEMESNKNMDTIYT